MTGAVWVSVNERDELGDDLPPDYFTSIKDGGFYGWPYSYIGDNVDPRVKPQRPDLVAKAIIPDVLLGPHVAPLQFTFYTAQAVSGVIPRRSVYRGTRLVESRGAQWLSGGVRGIQGRKSCRRSRALPDWVCARPERVRM